MSFGPRFINLLDEDNWGRNGLDIYAALANVENRTSGPVVVYISRPCILSQSIRSSARVALMFGPAGRVVLQRGLGQPTVEWRIEGETDLGIELRFIDTEDSRVLLLGPLDCIRPEWFRRAMPLQGVSYGFNDESTVVTESSDNNAMDAAIACALARIEAGVPQVPIKLLGPYQLRRPVSIPGRAASNEIELCFEGRHPRGDDGLLPTFRRHPASYSAHALWKVGEGVRVIVRDVAFDARGDDALPAGTDSAAVVHLGFHDGTLYERCTFFLDRGDGILAVTTLDQERASGDAGVPFRLTLLGCWFDCRPLRQVAAAVRMGEAGSARLRVDGCSFRGDAEAMIAVVHGMIEVTACDFHNEPIAASRPLPQAGVDLLLGAPARSGKVSKGPLGPLVLTLLHVQTRSIKHLRGVRTGSAGDSVVTLTGLVARRRSFIDASATPVVQWEGASGDQLLLQGCDLNGPIVPAPDVTGSAVSEVAVHRRS